MYIAPFILESEYRCKCCGKLPPFFEIERYIYDELFRTFETLRERYGEPIPILSGYRCIDHNKEVGGVTYSAHIFGMALDIACKDRNDIDTKRQLLLNINPDIRMGLYYDKNFIHLDTVYRIVPRLLPQWKRGALWLGG